MPRPLTLRCCCCLPAGPCRRCALESQPVVSARATVALVSDTDAVTPGQPFRVGLRLRLTPGWHTYWHNPGDAGVAPDLDLTLPAGSDRRPDRLARAASAWPRAR